VCVLKYALKRQILDQNTENFHTSAILLLFNTAFCTVSSPPCISEKRYDRALGLRCSSIDRQTSTLEHRSLDRSPWPCWPCLPYTVDSSAALRFTNDVTASRPARLREEGLDASKSPIRHKNRYRIGTTFETRIGGGRR
jgi:hypothetical protein